MSENNAFWNYAVQLYSTPEIAELCLLLQNRYQLSVNSLLFALWLARQGRKLPANLDDNAVRQWRVNMLEPLRQLRYQLRSSKQSPQEYDCYAQLKKAELAAERVESGLFYELRECCPDVARAGGEAELIDLQQLGYLNLCIAADSDSGVAGNLQALLKQLNNKATGCGGN
ncbi:TIGR02444 family protein [uncultured Amphritea sp.]|uniref:TIGR02444 family protein n=1 Tax=uncultured Amphritea sp. TaxID=981605 RepID=UPI0026384AFE|nr:TIGR02444 family protein [uncultured Amphritea sp.]